MAEIEPKHRSTIRARPSIRPTSVEHIRPQFENVQHVGSKTASSGHKSSFLEADGTRSTQDVRRPWTKRSGDSQNRMAIGCAVWIASRAAARLRRRVAVARPVRIDFCTNLRFFSLIWRLTAHDRRKMCGVRKPNAASIRRTAWRYGVRNGTPAALPPGDVDASLSRVPCESISARISVFPRVPKKVRNRPGTRTEYP